MKSCSYKKSIDLVSCWMIKRPHHAQLDSCWGLHEASQLTQHEFSICWNWLPPIYKDIYVASNPWLSQSGRMNSVRFSISPKTSDPQVWFSTIKGNPRIPASILQKTYQNFGTWRHLHAAPSTKLEILRGHLPSQIEKDLDLTLMAMKSVTWIFSFL